MRIYPRTKWSNTATSEEQVEHIYSEVMEVVTEECNVIHGTTPDERAAAMERRDLEVSDLEHSIQTYWDCRAREGADVDTIRQKVIEKNRARSYYPEGGCADGNADDTRQTSTGS